MSKRRPGYDHYKSLVGRLSAKVIGKSSFVISALVFARNAAPERAAPEDNRYVTTNLYRRKQKLVNFHPPEFLTSVTWKPESGGRYRIRTYDFHRVKMALYR